MRHPLFQHIENQYKRAKPLEFEIGDDVVVTIKIIEGAKERLQDFEGAVIARKGAGLDEMFTVRRLVGDEGVERTFPIHSPKVVAIKTKRSGRIRRCKLYFLRDRTGKARKLKAKRLTALQKQQAAEARAAKRQANAEAAKVAARSSEMAMAASGA